MGASMARMALEIEVRGVEDAADRIERLGDRATEPGAAWEQIREELVKSERRAWGRGWAPLAPSTRRTNRARGESTEPLVASGDLKRSLTVVGAPHQVFKPENDQMTFGTDLFYARWAAGGRKNGTNQPPRKLIKVLTKERRAIKEIILEHIMSVRD